MRKKPQNTLSCSFHYPKRPSSKMDRLENAAIWNEAAADQWKQDQKRATSKFVKDLAERNRHRHEAQALSLWHQSNDIRTGDLNATD